MATIRQVYRTGGSVVICIPQTHLELCGLEAGSSVRLDVHTPASLLEEMGVSEAYMGGMNLSQMRFIVVREQRQD